MVVIATRIYLKLHVLNHHVWHCRGNGSSWSSSVGSGLICGYRTSLCFSLDHDSSHAISLPRLIKQSEELAEELELEKAKLAKLVDLVRNYNH